MKTSQNKKTIIELSAFENANIKLPPIVTGTVYEAQTFAREKISDDKEDDDDDDDDDGLDRDDDGADAPIDLLLTVDKYLKERAAKILQQNPWLASRIIPNPRKKKMKKKISKLKTKAKKMKFGRKLAIEFPTEMTEEECEERVESVVRIVTSRTVGAKLLTSTTANELKKSESFYAMKVIVANPLSENTYSDIVKAVRPHLHSSTKSVVGSKNCGLWDILLIPITESTTSRWESKFLLVHSLNHSLADGATLYKIYSMLSSDRPIEKLDPTRSVNFDALKKEALGGDPNFLRSKFVLPGLTKRLLRVGIGANPSLDPEIGPNQTSMWTVDEEKIEAIKEAHKAHKPSPEEAFVGDGKSPDSHERAIEPSVPYVSTNDILTSWFLRQNTDAALGCMIVDMRGRHPEITPNLAGNYEAELIYSTPSDVASPAWIRASLTRPDGLLKRAKDRALPGYKVLTGGLSSGAPGVSIVTNWSSFYETVVLKQNGDTDLRPEAHFPIFLQHDDVINSAGWNTLVIFRYSDAKLGVLVMAPRAATESKQVPVDRPAIVSN
eukprot:jgi/Psemu1/7332/gm1.7332_g